jgi:peptide/nickel transport system permease protein
MFWREFRKSPVALFGAGPARALYLSAIFADFLAPWPMTKQDLNYSYHPPTTQCTGPTTASSSARTCSHTTSSTSAGTATRKSRRRATRSLVPNGEETYRAVLARPDEDQARPGRRAGAPLPVRQRQVRARRVVAAPLRLARVAHDRALGILISFAIGMLVRRAVGYLGGGIDMVTMRVTELILSIPALYLILALRAAFPMNLPSDRMYMIIVVILAFIGWATLARVVRGMVLSLREFEYVTAARALGAGTLADPDAAHPAEHDQRS